MELDEQSPPRGEFWVVYKDYLVNKQRTAPKWAFRENLSGKIIFEGRQKPI